MNQEVAVVMPVYNGAAFLHESISSILTQTYQDFQFIIIDDGSTDESVSIIKAFNDKRIVFYQNYANQGIVHTLNSAFSNINSKYIARMDSDDISLPTRLQRQVEFMNSHPDIVIAGSWFETINDRNAFRTPVSLDEIAIALLEYNPIAHPSVIIRKAEWDKAGLYYSDLYPYAEDYACWVRAVLQHREITNIPEVLLIYREHTKQVSTQFKDLQISSVQRIVKFYLYNLYPNLLPKEIDLVFKLFSNAIIELSDYREIKKLLKRFTFSNDLLNDKLLSVYIRSKTIVAVNNIYVIVSDPILQVFIESLTDEYYFKNLSFIQKVKFPIKLVKKILFG